MLFYDSNDLPRVQTICIEEFYDFLCGSRLPAKKKNRFGNKDVMNGCVFVQLGASMLHTSWENFKEFRLYLHCNNRTRTLYIFFNNISY